MVFKSCTSSDDAMIHAHLNASARCERTDEPRLHPTVFADWHTTDEEEGRRCTRILRCISTARFPWSSGITESRTCSLEKPRRVHLPFRTTTRAQGYRKIKWTKTNRTITFHAFNRSRIALLGHDQSDHTNGPAFATEVCL